MGQEGCCLFSKLMVSVLSLAISNFKWLFLLLYMTMKVIMYKLHIHKTKPRSFPHSNHVSLNKKEETQLPLNRKSDEEVSSNTEPDCCC